MSTTETRRTYQQGLQAAEAFRALFDPSACERWEFAGSLRRKSNSIGDLEHVVIPKFGDVPSDDMFATPDRRNLLLTRMDELVAQGKIVRHIYGNGQRWGGKRLRKGHH